jgi:hypothetical protein
MTAQKADWYFATVTIAATEGGSRSVVVEGGEDVADVLEEVMEIVDREKSDARVNVEIYVYCYAIVAGNVVEVMRFHR